MTAILRRCDLRESGWYRERSRHGVRRAAESARDRRSRAPRERYDRETYRKAVERACKKADVAVWHPHQLRHGFATRKLEDGLDQVTVAALMGHADATMLSRVYSHVGDRHDYLREQLNRPPS